MGELVPFCPIGFADRHNGGMCWVIH
jgi:hypothetical protein